MHRRRALVHTLAFVALPSVGQGVVGPESALSAAEGAWRGTLTYRDYSRPDRLVTLPTRLTVALAAASVLTLHYVFDDGPGKTVHAYERMAFDFSARTLVWVSGYPATRTSENRVTASQAAEGGLQIAFEREDDGTVSRYTMGLHPRSLTLAKDEGTAADGYRFRNRFEFTRDGA